MQEKPIQNEKAANAVDRMLTLMARLRDPEFGCAWDRKQDWKSLAAHTLEEVYEVIDAIERNDPAHLQDELGDLLFQIVFYAQIANEQQLFDFAAVADAITSKLLRRHPHVFPDGTLASFAQPNADGAINAGQVEVNWELIKNAEREGRGAISAGEALAESSAISVLDDIPNSFPAINRAAKLQKRAASVGFDWTDTGAVMAKLLEEYGELQQAIAAGEQGSIAHEVGDLLFTCVNIARHLRVEPEQALRDANTRFERRFRHVETAAKRSDIKLQTMDTEQLEALWQMAKSLEQGSR